MTESLLSMLPASPAPQCEVPVATPSNLVLIRMASALASAFSLPEPEMLADLLGVQSGQDVQIVLQRWICRCLLDIDDVQATQLLPNLVGRLDLLLSDRRAL